MNDERLIVTGLELPITDVKELRRIAQTCYTEGRKDGAIDELEKIKAEMVIVMGSVAETQEDLTRMETRNDDIEIIDNHIKELKGE